jgi:hypothetical protein
MGEETQREKAIMTQIIKLHKKIDYLTDEVMCRLDKMSKDIRKKEGGEAQKDFPFAPKQGIQSISIKTKEENE